MKIFENLKKRLAKSAKANFSLAFYSVILACIVWFVISIALYPSVTRQIRDVQLSVDISGSTASENGLSVISCNLEHVDITVKGSRTQASKLHSDSFTAYIDTADISTPGKKNLPIKIRSKDNIPFEVESITPSTVTVTLDKYETVEKVIEPKCPNITAVNGKIIYQAEHKCNPDKVKITGPSTQLEKIDKCYAFSDKKMVLDSSVDLPTDTLQLLTEDGTIIDQSMLDFNTSTFSINIPVLSQKTVQLSVQIVGGSADFDKSSLKFDMPIDSITVASRNSQFEIGDSLEIGKINISDIDLGFSKTFNISNLLEESGVINMSGVEDVALTLDDSDLERRDFTLDKSNIHITNKPSGNEYDYELMSQSVKICVVGPKDELAKLSSADFAADANLLNTDTTEGTFYYDVTVSCFASDKVWAVANPSKPSVLIKKTRHVEPEPTTEPKNNTAQTTTSPKS